MLRRATLLVLVAGGAGCTKSNPAYCDQKDGCEGDLVCDIATNTCIDQPCFGPTGWNVCLDPPMSRDPLILPETISTGPIDNGAMMVGTTSPLCLNPTPASWAMNLNQHDACVVTAYKIVVNGPVLVTGGRPLVLVANDEIDITGTLDLSSHSPDHIGAGAFNLICDRAAAQAMSVGQVGGGGGGGSFSTAGAKGTDGEGGAMASEAGVAELPPFDTLHAGCKGGTGGYGNAYAAGGLGGGAVYLAAGNAIVISGTINASGDGGFHGLHITGGGGGGGSGGMIVFDAPTITLSPTGRIAANGGGGGGGATQTMDGVTGGVTDSSMPLVAALGGNGATENTQQAAMGGAGGTRDKPATGGTAGTSGGGGGGGGGLGVIRVLSSQLIEGNNVSPLPRH